MAEVLEPTPENVERVADCVRDGGVVVAPSDTNMALTVDPWHSDAIERVYEIKDRPEHKPLTLFVRDPGDWRRFGQHDDPETVEALVAEFWPGPLNLVLRRTNRVHDERLCMDDTVSIGCLSNPVWRDLAAAVGGPLAMTSANQSGTVADDELVDVETAVEHVGGGDDQRESPDESSGSEATRETADYVLAGEPQGTSRASTILSLAGEPEVLRRGDISTDELEVAADLSLR